MPVDVELATTSVIGCCSNESCEPAAGCSSLGWEIVTPAMGPAIDGLVGFALLASSQPARSSTGKSHRVERRQNKRAMGKPHEPGTKWGWDTPTLRLIGRSRIC